MTSSKHVLRFAKLALILGTFGSVALGQSLSTFTCTPTSIVRGASINCTITLTSAAALAGFPVKISSTTVGLTYPATVTIPYLAKTSTFRITSSTSTVAPQVAKIVATAGGISKTASVTITLTTTYSISSLSCTPARLIPEQMTTCAATLSAEAPAGGLVATLASSSANLPVPASVTIAATATGFKFSTTASSLATLVEDVTITGTLKGNMNTTTVTIDPTPKFYLKGDNSELTLLTDGATVYPSAGPSDWLGTLNVRGVGYLAFDPVTGTSGISFHQNGGQNVDTAFVNFTGSTFAGVFNTATEISFQVKSAYSFAERKLLPATNSRAVFEVYDDTISRNLFQMCTSSAGALQFGFGALGYTATYTVPAGQEDVVFGKGVTVNIRIKWTTNSYTLYVNGAAVQTMAVSPKTANWSARSALTIGSRSSRIGTGGYYASDDAIAELTIR
jgi:hypothetical protein